MYTCMILYWLYTHRPTIWRMDGWLDDSAVGAIFWRDVARPSDLNQVTFIYIYILWRVSRALLRVALETEEKHLHAIIVGWPTTAVSHQKTATKATESHTLVRHVSRRLTANPFSIWLPESSVWPASHRTWAQHGHPALGHSDGGQRRITEHRFTAPRHVGTLYLTNKHTLRCLYCTPLVVWFLGPSHWWRIRASSWRITRQTFPSQLSLPRVYGRPSLFFFFCFSL